MYLNNRKFRVAVIGGGGDDAFIVHAHDRSLNATLMAEITCGVLSRDSAKSLLSAAKWPYPITGYRTIAELILETEKSSDTKVDFALIVTPNNVHADQTAQFIEAGIPVYLEKPVTVTVGEALRLAALAKMKNVPLGVAHTYPGHWSSQLASHIVRNGLIGEVIGIDSFYSQEWLVTELEKTGQRQASWRVDPAAAGPSGCGGDIVTHAYRQACFITGQKVEEILYAHARSIFADRKLDDNLTTFCRMTGGAFARIGGTQTAIGHMNDLRTEVNGRHGSVSWVQEDSEKLVVSRLNKQVLIYRRGNMPDDDSFLGKLPEHLRNYPVLPGGHSEGFENAFTHLYVAFIKHVRAWQENPKAHPVSFDSHECGYSTIADGVDHMRFIEAALEAAQTGKPVNIFSGSAD